MMAHDFRRQSPVARGATIGNGAIEMKATRFLLAAVLIAAPAFAQQNVDISGKDFESGAGDAKLATLGRQAAASGKRIVVTAPQEWHGKIAAKIRSGGAADVVLKDGFYENVLVRVEDKPAEPKPEEKPAPKPEPKPAQRTQADRVPMDVPGPKPTLPPPVEEKPVVAAAPPPPVAPPPAPVAKPAPAPAVAAAPPKEDTAAIKKRLENSLNGGKPAEGPLSVANVLAGDFIFVDGEVRAVVRRESLRPRMFWLEGELDLRRAELKELGPNRYQVMEAIRGENYSVRGSGTEASKTIEASAPAANSPIRATFERDYNDGHSIDDTTTIEKLRAGDVVYTGRGVAVVVRREGRALMRAWLEGSLDLGQAGLQKDGANKYKVISDTIH
jgi:outer membrane biosynthesis protein TonB